MEINGPVESSSLQCHTLKTVGLFHQINTVFGLFVLCQHSGLFLRKVTKLLVQVQHLLGVTPGMFL